MSEASYTSTADSNARSSHLSPNAVGDWILGRKLGKGTQGTVRLGQHSRTKELCAIKIIARKPEYQQGVPLPRTPQEAQQASLKIQREIVLMKLIDHPNLIKMRDVWESKRELFVVMEYIDGIQLFEYVCHNGALGTPDALHIFQQLVSAVSYCHKFNITHRDLKLENIMITPSHTIKIVDFGLAAWGAVEGKVLETSCGSPHYASPEVVSGETYRGDLADVWSCGVIFYALLVGRLPFDEQDGGGVEEVLEKVRRGVFHMPARLDHWAKDLLSRMLEKDVAKRITMDHIEQHPFYLAYPQRAIPGRPAPPTTEAIDQLIVDEASLDAILFKNMEALWPRRPAHEIKSRLLLAGPTWEKFVYYMLMKYRGGLAEDIASPPAKSPSDGRRTPTPKASLADTDTEDRMATPRPSAPTPKKARNAPAITPSATPLTATAPLKIVPKQVRRKPVPLQLTPPASTPTTPVPVIAVQEASPVRPKTPLPHPNYPDPSTPKSPLASLGEITIPKVNDAAIDAFFHEIVDQLSAVKQALDVPSPRVGSPASQEPEPYISETMHVPKIGLGLLNVDFQPQAQHGRYGSQRSQASLDSSQNGNKENFENGSLMRRLRSRASTGGDGKRRALGDRQVQASSPREYIADKSQPTTPLTPTSPLLSPDLHASNQSPSSLSHKKSWLNRVTFKAPQYNLLSMENGINTRDTCWKLLQSYGVIVVWAPPEVLKGRGSAGSLRCTLPEMKDPNGIVPDAKSVRFRVEVEYASDASGYTSSLTLTHERGALPSFKLVCTKLRLDWDLDNSPAPSRFVSSPVRVSVA